MLVTHQSVPASIPVKLLSNRKWYSSWMLGIVTIKLVKVKQTWAFLSSASSWEVSFLLSELTRASVTKIWG